MSIKILGYDVETTGLDTQNDSIIELGAVVWDVESNFPLEMLSTFVSGVVIEEKHAAALAVNRINPEWLKLGMPIQSAFAQIQYLIEKHDVTHVIAHNGEGYDKPITLAELKRCGHMNHPFEKLPWVDSRYDVPFSPEPTSRRLPHLAADHGIVNFFEHRALFDVLTMLKIVSKYDFNKIIEQSKIPWIVVRALVDYDNREKAKEARFSWENLGEKKYPKFWVKKIRENLLEKEQASAEAKNFKVVQIE